MAVKQPKTVPTAHTAGIFADMSLDGPEIGTLVAVIDRARNLPNRKTMGKQDAYCAMRLGKEARKTETDRRGGQTPKWDQELRFTVHESPDYYKMKCSVFNDDKKADLIGECWVDLREVIVAGGGQNDLWHQLNFKGKYAGDVRIELTYYDTRPAQDTPTEVKKRSNRAKSIVSETASAASTSRQFGPREIKRRPLPPGPGQQPLPQVQSQVVGPLQPTQPFLQQSYPTPPASINGDMVQPYIAPLQPSRSRTLLQQPPEQPQQQERWPTPETPDDFGYCSRSSSQGEQYEGQNYNRNYSEYPSQHEPEPPFQHDQYHHNEQAMQSYHSSPYSSVRASPQSVMGHQQAWEKSSPPISPHGQPSYNPATQYSSPLPRQSPSPLPQIPTQQRSSRNDASPTKHGVYRDSPLRQSLNPNDLLPPPGTMQVRNEDLDLPPAPPAHRDGYARRPVPQSHHSLPHNSSLPATPLKQQTVEDRSPLQHLEQTYGSQYVSSAPRAPLSQPYPRDRSPGPSPQPSQGSRPSLQDRRGSSIGEFPAPHQMSTNYGIDLEEPIEQDRQGRYVRRLSSNEPQDDPYRISRGSQPSNYVDVFDERNTYRSEPQIVRPRAVSPNPRYDTRRKSISPLPYSRPSQAQVSSTPFAPDSYDVLNPASSPANAGVFAPEQLSEAKRQTEVNKMRDLGPIIGNDGRVIDPSDHLPSDTWAPEPERKNRKPEHVIRFKTKEESRTQPRTHSSPIPVRPMSTYTSPYSGSPNAAVSPLALNHSSPNLPSLPPSSTGRNKLQKPMPARPLPTQPFQHANTSPAAIPQVKDHEHKHPEGQRNSTYSSPPAKTWHRPPLTEYQVPVGNTYDPRAVYKQSLPQTPTKVPQRPQSYAYNGYQDPLAAEMSMIDIGPPRSGGRTAVRPNRGYGGY